MAVVYGCTLWLYSIWTKYTVKWFAAANIHSNIYWLYIWHLKCNSFAVMWYCSCYYDCDCYHDFDLYIILKASLLPHMMVQFLRKVLNPSVACLYNFQLVCSNDNDEHHINKCILESIYWTNHANERSSTNPITKPDNLGIKTSFTFFGCTSVRRVSLVLWTLTTSKL